jgi:hypothetical protein
MIILMAKEYDNDRQVEEVEVKVNFTLQWNMYAQRGS